MSRQQKRTRWILGMVSAVLALSLPMFAEAANIDLSLGD
jgi:hypothetical protein